MASPSSASGSAGDPEAPACGDAGLLALVPAQDPETGPVAVLDGALAMDVSVALHGGQLSPALRRGAACPCAGEAELLTSSRRRPGARRGGRGAGPAAAGRGLRGAGPRARGPEPARPRAPAGACGSPGHHGLAPWRFHLQDPHARHAGYTLGGRFLHVVEAPVPQAEGEAVDPEATAGKVWPCGYYLAAYAAREIAGSCTGACQVLELGAGQGLVGMALAAAGVRVTCTDLSENMPLLRENLRVNGLAEQVTLVDLDWRCPASRSRVAASHRFDAVVAADCVFWPELFRPLLDCLAAVLSRGSTAYLALVHRQHTVETFLQMLKAEFEVQELAGWCVETYLMNTPRLYLVRHRAAVHPELKSPKASRTIQL
ncbi:unnamed protein product [Prorocentrum cordatum]|uniref:Calmodulin-lysine N-methyltransferase n=1 Tax=Prorocentrum cordatum TaxID=2364126 RepID=A0ABN9TBZ7_9DINO|nr:unnamed protein product [Polarella glacialis]